MVAANFGAAAKRAFQIHELGAGACLDIVFAEIVDVDRAFGVWRLYDVVEFLFITRHRATILQASFRSEEAW